VASFKAWLPLILLVSVSTVGLSVLSTHRVAESAATNLVLRFAFALVIALWVQGDRRKRQVSVPYEFDAFVFFFWYVAMPYYLYKTRGWRGLMVALAIVILVATPVMVSTILEAVARLL
jgi:hypothetical protein